jgi:hypothetical protein
MLSLRSKPPEMLAEAKSAMHLLQRQRHLLKQQKLKMP